MRILVATDGSSHSELAAKTLVALRPPQDAEVVVLHVKEEPHYTATPAVPPSYLHEWHRVQRELHSEAQEAADRAVERTKQILAGIGCTIRSLVVEGHPADQIIRVAKEIAADLVVVGSKGLTGSAIFPLGSVSQKVKRYSSCSVLLTKPTPQAAEPKIAKVILATDGSDNAFEAARFLSGFGISGEAEVELLTVVHQPTGIPPFSSSPTVVEQIRQARLEDAERVLQETRRHISVDAKVTATVREGSPAEQILQTGSAEHADLIVVGSKGLGGIKLFLLGSVSERVCRYSDRSVLLVKMRHESKPSSEGQPA